jgi:nicotinamidase-related amidase
MKKVLIVIDMQNDFITGSLGSAQALAIVPNVKKKIDEYESRNNYLIFTKDTHYEDYLNTQEGRNIPVEHCINETNGWNIHDDVFKDRKWCCRIYKNTFGWVRWEDSLLDIINDIDEIELCGLCTDICVVSNALILKAIYPEIKITVDATCCAGVTEESHNAALLVMKMCHINTTNISQ